MIKSEIRKLFLNKQRNLSAVERRQKSTDVVGRLFNEFDFSRQRLVSCFVTLEKNNELDTAQIFERLHDEFPNIITTAPRVDFETNLLEHVRVSPSAGLLENKWGILEPQGDVIFAAETLDAVLVPLLSFDERGFRVGYGKGFYDRFLKKCRADCRKIGLSLFPPVEKIDNVEDFDVRLDQCVTPEKFWPF